MTIATTEQTNNEMGSFDERDEQVMRYLGLNPSSPADRAMVAVCRHYDFDPLLKHVVVIPKGGVYITRDGLLHVAHRSRQLDGIVVEQEPTLVNGEWVCRVSVYRKDMRHPFTFPGRYPVSGSNKQYAQEMALKAAESHALRRAFDVTGLPTFDEQRPEPTHTVTVEQSAPAAERMAAMLDDQVSDASTAPSVPPSAEVEQVVATVGASESPLLTNKNGFGRGFYARMGERDWPTDEARLEYVVESIGRFVESTKEISEDEARMVLARLDEEGAVDAEVVS